MAGEGAAGGETKRCSDCNAAAPTTNTNYTLISKQHGWRLTLTTLPNGRKLSEWRCPQCFARRRAKVREG